MIDNNSNTLLIIITLLFNSVLCAQEGVSYENSLQSRIKVPEGYSRAIVQQGSFGEYLRSLPLKPEGSRVKYYNGNYKSNDAYVAVVDLPIGNKDLHQCADAVIHLRAAYLYANSRFNDIHFNFTNGFRADYSEWAKGKRIAISGNKTWWEQKAPPSNSDPVFWSYLETVFTYAGTWSLSKELVSVQVKDLQIGDVFIQGGSPGHAVIVVDVAYHEATGKKIFLLAQSYMPAQEIQILKNPAHSELNPWYSENFGMDLMTPEWRFTSNDLKKFE